MEIRDARGDTGSAGIVPQRINSERRPILIPPRGDSRLPRSTHPVGSSEAAQLSIYPKERKP